MTIAQITHPVFGDTEQISAIKFHARCQEAAELLDAASNILASLRCKAGGWEGWTPELRLSLEYLAEEAGLEDYFTTEGERELVRRAPDVLDTLETARLTTIRVHGATDSMVDELDEALKIVKEAVQP